MKKLITSAAVCSIALCALVSCGDKSSKKNGDIVGKWSMSGIENSGIEDGGLIFKADGKGSVFEDTSSILHFESEGFNIGGTVISDNYIKEDGDNLVVDIEGKEMLDMTRLEGRDGKDGLYSLKGGMLYTSIVEKMSANGSFDENNLDITIDFDGAHSEVIFNNIFTYTTKKDKLTISGFSGFLKEDSDSAAANGGSITADYKISGNTLSIIDSKGTETLTRVQ
ncbi:MAG: hypothetical protein J6U00_10430 [Ruminococcus sp.]|uniref:hypothetical protein n=1 Tax=Ruminococcus sp. TaxID=41978 RepID=UPI001B0480AB|nr:hypothetical protein [Ruminococcus sp.]MBO7474392.1 hypothetical protein [Ruminococcus sp.]